MSATAAAPHVVLNNQLYFMDCDPDTYCSGPEHCPKDHIGLIIVTNLFGQCAPLTRWRAFADKIGALLIEDASQAPFAMTPDGRLSGTVGDVGVHSFNVHKHMQAGEGGMIVTNSDQLAEEMRDFINHGEMRGSLNPGLNLRMTEITAAIAGVQLDKSDEIIASRIALAHELSDMVKDFWVAPFEMGKHVFYHWAVRVPNRVWAWSYLLREGVPVRAGYTNPLHRVPAFKDFASPCPIAEKAHDHDLLIFETCAWDPDKQQLNEMREIFKRASEASIVYNASLPRT
jgi:dTDP-4-amino-4,6-dideoxygalactose transaminase